MKISRIVVPALAIVGAIVVGLYVWNNWGPGAQA